MAGKSPSATLAALRRELSHFPGTGAVHALDLETGRELSCNPDAVLEIASTFKLVALVTAYRQADAGLLDLDREVTTGTQDTVRGSGILRELVDPVSTTVRNLLRLMIIVSDNVATIRVLRLIGVPALNETAVSLGAPHTVFYAGDAAAPGEAGTSGEAAAAGESGAPGAAGAPYATSTARELVSILAAILEDRAAAPHRCREMRELLARQFYLDQIPRYLPSNPYAADLGEAPAVVVRNKSGFSVGVRSDVASIELPGHAPLIVATISNWEQRDGARHSLLQEPVCVLHGTLARLIVDGFRPGCLTTPFVPFSAREPADSAQLRGEPDM
jgi:beta-lactamase class A